MGRAAGRGCIRQRTPGSYEILYYVDGKKRQETVKGTKRDAERRRTEILRSIDTKTYLQPSKMTVEQLLLRWLEEGTKVGPTTLERYRGVAHSRYIPAIGQRKVDSIQPLDIQDLYATWRQEGLADSAISVYHNVIRQAFEMAVRLRVIALNPATAVAPKATARRERGILNEEEMNRLIYAAKDGLYYAPLVLAIATGLRIGEICGLKWEDIDFEGKTLIVNRTAARLNGDVVLKDPKTRSSRRMIRLPDSVVEVLRGLPRENDLLFPGKNGRPARPVTVSAWIRRLCRRLGYKVTTHDLRHSHASFLLREKEDVKAVSERLGHSGPGVTMGTYAHSLPLQHREIAERVERSLGAIVAK